MSFGHGRFPLLMFCQAAYTGPTKRCGHWVRQAASLLGSPSGVRWTHQAVWLLGPSSGVH
ncbi:hypothetical protein HMPREF9080_02839 [Cardiobacterium valvarum F0432]|uniref:Uncharacterized protein n=1 Tax=Cardiobacterium valvarum F0432 TaxID=797473 RepID=G9ZJ69_9GAMM|nr:hypothetical protein HMPREF9080_02839 [Cardiobacterium valvarum F0432]